MSEPDNNRLQELFLAAVEMPAEDRDVWLIEQCGDDEQLLADVRELLSHDNPQHDPLEQGLDAALGGIPSTLIPNPQAGSNAGHDSQRSSQDAPWSNPRAYVEPINTPEPERFSTISDDGRLLIFARGEPLKEDLWMATRSGWDAPWSDPAPLDGLNSDGGEQSPKLLRDGESLLFGSDRPGGHGSHDIWLARLVRKQPAPIETRR